MVPAWLGKAPDRWCGGKESNTSQGNPGSNGPQRQKRGLFAAVSECPPPSARLVVRRNAQPMVSL
eukprot:3315852-Lingulodinium_polyedra.AAC.1